MTINGKEVVVPNDINPRDGQYYFAYVNKYDKNDTEIILEAQDLYGHKVNLTIDVKNYLKE